MHLPSKTADKVFFFSSVKGTGAKLLLLMPFFFVLLSKEKNNLNNWTNCDSASLDWEPEFDQAAPFSQFQQLLFDNQQMKLGIIKVPFIKCQHIL